MTFFRKKKLRMPKELKQHIGRLSPLTIDLWNTIYANNITEESSFYDIANYLLLTVENNTIKDPEFVVIAVKAGIITGQLARVLDITWKYQEPCIRVQAALALVFKGQIEEAKALLKAAEHVAELKDDLPIILELLGIRSFILTIEKKYEEAIGVYIKTSQIAGDDKNLEYWSQWALLRQAYALLKLGYINEASIASNKALMLSNRYEDRFFKIQALTGLGYYSDITNKADDGLAFYKEALLLANEIHALNFTSIILNRIGMSIAWYKKHIDDSIDFFRQSIATAQSAGSEWLIFGPMSNLGIIKKMQREYFEAQELFEGVKDHSSKIGNINDQLFAFINLSDIYKEMGDKKRAEEYKKIAQDLVKLLQSDYRSDKPGTSL